MKVLIACEFSGVVREAFRAKGHDAWSCDILPARDGSPFHIQGDVLEVLDQGWDLMIAHPPCTELAVTGQRWYKPEAGRFRKPDSLREEALEFVRKLMDAPIPKIAVENPVSIISSRIRKSDQLINPWEYGHPESKRTCLWLKNLPKLVPTNDVKAVYDAMPRKERHRIWQMGSNRNGQRSVTYQGIADAMAEQWGIEDK